MPRTPLDVDRFINIARSTYEQYCAANPELTGIVPSFNLHQLTISIPFSGGNDSGGWEGFLRVDRGSDWVEPPGVEVGRHWHFGQYDFDDADFDALDGILEYYWSSFAGEFTVNGHLLISHSGAELVGSESYQNYTDFAHPVSVLDPAPPMI